MAPVFVSLPTPTLDARPDNRKKKSLVLLAEGTQLHEVPPPGSSRRKGGLNESTAASRFTTIHVHFSTVALFSKQTRRTETM